MLTTGLAGAEDWGDPQVGGARVKYDTKWLRWTTDGDHTIVAQLEEVHKTIISKLSQSRRYVEQQEKQIKILDSRQHRWSWTQNGWTWPLGCRDISSCTPSITLSPSGRPGQSYPWWVASCSHKGEKGVRAKHGGPTFNSHQNLRVSSFSLSRVQISADSSQQITFRRQKI